jgi:hypothetical protein
MKQGQRIDLHLNWYEHWRLHISHNVQDRPDLQVKVLDHWLEIMELDIFRLGGPSNPKRGKRGRIQ